MNHVLDFTDDELVDLFNGIWFYIDQIRDTAMWNGQPEPTERIDRLQGLSARVIQAGHPETPARSLSSLSHK